MTETPQTTIVVCETCAYSDDEKLCDGKTGGEILATEVERLAAEKGLNVRRHACLMGCDRHCNVAVTAPGKLSYVIGKFDPVTESAEAIVAYAALHNDSENGTVPYRQWPQGVKGHFVARIPAL